MSVDSEVNNKPMPRSVKVGQSRSKRAGLRKPIKKVIKGGNNTRYQNNLKRISK